MAGKGPKEIKKKQRITPDLLWKQRYLLMMSLPFVIWLIIFKYIPLWGWTMAFQEVKPATFAIPVWERPFAGFQNFIKAFQDRLFAQTMVNTIGISILQIAVGTVVAIAFAVLLNELVFTRFKKITQTVSYLPHFLSWVVIAGIWYEFLSPSNGLVMDIAAFFGGERKNLLTDKNSILWVLFASSTWRSMGWDSIIYLSAILGIDTALYEAAKMDGASRWKTICYIILPALAGPMVTVLILNVGFVMSAGYDQILNFSNDAVLSRVDILDTYVYRIGLLQGQYSFATAANLFKGVIGTAMILLTHFTSKKLTGKGAW